LTEKYLLKRSMKGLLPEAVRRRNKQPYRAPDNQSFFHNGQPVPYVSELLSEKRLTEAGYFDPAAVAKLLAKDWGVKANIVPVTGPNRIPFLLTNKVDVLVASLAITPERAKQVAFSTPYAAATIVLYGKTGAAIKSAADLKGMRVGVARASTQDVAVTKAAPEGTEIRRFDDDASAMQALMSGQVDAIGCSTTVAAQIAKRAPAGTYENKFNLRQQVMGVALRPGQAELKKTLDDFVTRNKANGELGKLYQKWLGTDFPSMPNS
jgi:polar amino acid transport system substrate-binding protein